MSESLSRRHAHVMPLARHVRNGRKKGKEGGGGEGEGAEEH